MRNCLIILKRLSSLSFLFLILLCTFYAFHVFTVSANTTFVPANYYPVAGNNVKEGAIVSFFNGSYILSKAPYDQFMIGVVTNNPAITQDIQGPIPFYPVISSGQGILQVSTYNGPIKKGDFLTSSIIPGVAVKATKAGYTIGVALDNYSVSDKKAVGKLPATLNIHYFIGNVQISSNLLDVLSLSAVATYESPSLVFKYVLAGGLVSLALLFSFVLISKTANKGIDALGRNPLSSTEIHIGMALNVFIAIIILVTGFVMGFLVLRL